MSTLMLTPSTSSIFSDIFKVKQSKYFNKLSAFVKDTNTKANALLAYWGAETIIDAVLATTLFVSGAYFFAFLAFVLTAYRTYAILGVLSDMRYV